MRPGRRVWLLALLASLVVFSYAVPQAVSPPRAQASYGISTGKGVDACTFPSVSQMQAWWTNTPYWDWGFYLGGSAAACPAPVTSSWLNQVHAQGWKFYIIWVGPQAPCSGFSSRMSSDPTTARQQGRDQALASYNKMVNVGMNVDQTPVIYDLENYNTGNSSCRAAVKAFMQGWVEQLHVPTAQKAGVYGSVCGSAIDDFAYNASPPDFIDGAYWNGNISTWNLYTGSCGVPSSHWTNQQRMKQYQGGHNETWNGVTINVDSDCTNAPVYPGPTDNANQGCS
jgi:Rv2525c-like, glycoside hydrolase-like domain